MKKLKTLFITAFLTLFFAGCYSPNPLYGKWSDNYGSTINFFPDNTYSASIVNSAGTTETYEGDFNVIENVISFSTETDLILTEWDIRGSILYITWSDSNRVTVQLSLYHVSK
ncbi:MAG: hypothetical protein J6Y36_02070 [Treponema sp.]|uniref:hypothetical protein n=1 Tax=Treponema sp. TaxID=166 RepID=UPI001B54B3FF|nr:hypothetical protein [Treponema sp.]MBP5401924.1 hypothetical protein [Treponema sp.]MBR5932477.1 hypothetical protein [Treponema sp.]